MRTFRKTDTFVPHFGYFEVWRYVSARSTLFFLSYIFLKWTTDFLLEIKYFRVLLYVVNLYFRSPKTANCPSFSVLLIHCSLIQQAFNICSLISTNGVSLNNLPSHYLGLNLEAKCHHFFFHASFTNCIFLHWMLFYSPSSQRSIRILFISGCITTYPAFRTVWNAQPTRPDREPKSDIWTLCKTAFPGFSFFSFGFLIEKHSNTVYPEV